MLIVDYLVSNIDRHDNNWGFYYDNNCCLVSLHPLFDHNMAFSSDAMYHDYQSRIMPEYSLFELARHACKKINFPSVAHVKVNMFHSREHYESFKEHCSKLNLK